jgi:hypothetical protein
VTFESRLKLEDRGSKVTSDAGLGNSGLNQSPMKSLLELALRTHKVIAFIFLALTFAANATSITWTNIAGGNWSAATNWSPNQVPTAADDVSLIGDSYTLTVDVPAFANSLIMGGGAPTLGGAGPVTLAGPLNWTNGTISTVIYCNGGTVNNPHALDGGQIINSGAMTWIPYPFTGNGSVISNTSTGTMNIQIAGDRITDNTLGGPSYFYNAGQINAAGSDTSLIGDTFINTGSVAVSNGTLLAGAGGTNFGTMTAQASGTVGVADGNFYFSDTSVLSGLGGFLVTSGTANVGGALNLSGNWTVSGGTANFTGTTSASGQTISISSGTANFIGAGPWTPGIVNFSGGTLAGPSPILDSGALNWNGGVITGVISCNGGTVNDPEGLDGGQIVNYGTMTWIPYPYTGAGSVISNASTGVMNLQLSRQLTENEYGGSSYFYNAGQINGSGSATGIIGDTFINTGTVTITSGTLEAAAGGTNFSTMTATGSGAIGVGGGTFYFADSSVLSGSGGFVVSGGTANVGGALNLSGSWTVSGGTANFIGTSSASGETLSISSTANFVGVGPWTPGIVNFSGGTLAGPSPILASGALNWNSGVITGIISCNGGTVNNPSGIDGGQLINYGPLNWIPYPYTGGGSVISNASTGTITLALNGRPFSVNSYGGTATLYNAGQFNASGSGSSTIGDTFINSGTINLQSGNLEASGAVVLEPSGALNVTVNGPTNLATFGISGPATLGGVLDLNFSGYTPHMGDSFTPVTYASQTGVFGAFILPQQVDWKAVYAPTSFSLHAIGLAAPYLTLEGLPVAVDTNGFQGLLIGPIGSNYTIQVSTDLEAWATLTNFRTSIYSSTIFDDPESTNYTFRAYRASISP